MREIQLLATGLLHFLGHRGVQRCHKEGMVQRCCSVSGINGSSGVRSANVNVAVSSTENTWTTRFFQHILDIHTTCTTLVRWNSADTGTTYTTNKLSSHRQRGDSRSCGSKFLRHAAAMEMLIVTRKGTSIGPCAHRTVRNGRTVHAQTALGRRSSVSQEA